MRIRSFLLRSALLVVAMAPFGTVARGDLTNFGTANNYNVFLLGNDTQSNVDSEGKVAVGGNANLTNYTVASGLTGTSTTNLVVGGTLTTSNGAINGNAVVGGDASLSDPTLKGNLAANGNVTLSSYGSISGNVTHGGTINPNPTTTIGGSTTQGTTTLPVNFSAEATNLKNLSNSLTNASNAYTYGNGVTYQNNGFTLTGSNASIDVFNIKGSDLAGANSFTINAPSGATVVVNVDGTSDSISNLGFTENGVSNQYVVFNFSKATSLTTSGVGIAGSVLAPLAAISFNNGNINGTLIGASLTGNGEEHNQAFLGNLSSLAVPEPASVVSTLAGLAIAVGARWRSRRRAA